MPIDYSKYPANWLTEIRPSILERAEHKCEVCSVKNYNIIFRGYMENGREIYQDANGFVFDANTSEFLFVDFHLNIRPLSGKENQKAIKVVLTIAHLDNDIQNNDPINLQAKCQRCHNRADIAYRVKNRKASALAKKNESQINIFPEP